MKRKTPLIILFAGILCLAGSVLLWKMTTRSARTANPEADENPAALQEWELMRLRDPKTGRIPDHIRSQELAFAATLPQRGKHSKGESILQSATWAQRGPWELGGRTRALAIDAGNENILLAGGVSAGMWRSTDGGASWKRSTGMDQLSSISCITQDTRPGKQNIWYYGTGEFFGNSSNLNGDGIFKSTDGGVSWKPLTATVSNTPQTWDGTFEFVHALATDPSNTTQDEVYAAPTLGGIFRSVDGGATWKATLGSFGNGSSYFTDVVVTPTGVVYAALSEYSPTVTGAANRGLYRSTDGLTWTNITPSGWPAKYRRITIGVAPSDQNQVYFLAETPDKGFEGKFFTSTEIRTEWHSLWKYTYISGNGSGSGGAWEDRSKNLPAFGLPTGDFVSQGSYDMLVKVKPDDPNTVFVGGTNLYRSTDGFATNTKTAWIGGYGVPTVATKFPNYENHHPDQHTVIFLPSNPKVMLSGNDGGIRKTTDNLAPTVSWTSLNNGYITSQFYSVAIDHTTAGNNIVVGGAQDNGSWFGNSLVPTAPWTKPWGADGAYCAIANGRTSYYVSAQSGRIQRFVINDNGDTLVRTRVDPVGGTGYLFINPFVLDPNNTDRMYLAAGSILWRNNDLTAIPLGHNDSTNVNWDSLSNTRVADTISAVATSGGKTVPGNRVYYGTIKGKVYRLDGANTGNPTPVNITGTNFPTNAYVSCVAVDPRNSDKVIVAFSNYNIESIYYTTDAGASWKPISGNLEQSPGGGGSGPSCRWVSILPVGTGAMYFVGTSTGLYSTSYLNGSMTAWQQEGASSIGNTVVEMIDTRFSDGFVAVATHGSGIFSTNITGLPNVPAAPSLLSPADGSGNIPVSQKFEWVTPGETVTSVLQISKDAGFSTLFLEKSGLTNPSYTAVGLEPGFVRYYWRVRVVGVGGESSYSPVWSFTTGIGIPALQSPPSGSTAIPTNPTLTWQSTSGSVSYHLQVSISITFGSFFLDKNNIAETSYALSGLEPNKRYYWRVSASNGVTEGPFSSRWSFTTGTSSDVRQSQTQASFSIGRNYPNPAHGLTSIPFSLGKYAKVRLSIVDMTGREVAVPVNTDMQAGDHVVQFNTSQLSAGTYLYRLTADGITKTNSMIVR